MALASASELKNGVVTASAGNMAQGVAWNARRLGIACRVVVPDHAPETKLRAIRRLRGEIVKVPFDRWWQIIVSGGYDELPGLFIHPVCNRDVIAGNGTIGLEILDDLPDVAALVIPYGGGGLSSGIASAIRARKPETTNLRGRGRDGCAVGRVLARWSACGSGISVQLRGWHRWQERAGGNVGVGERLAG